MRPHRFADSLTTRSRTALAVAAFASASCAEPTDPCPSFCEVNVEGGCRSSSECRAFCEDFRAQAHDLDCSAEADALLQCEILARGRCDGATTRRLVDCTAEHASYDSECLGVVLE